MTPASSKEPASSAVPALTPTVVTDPNYVVPSPAWDGAQTAATKKLHNQRKDALSSVMDEIHNLYLSHGVSPQMVQPPGALAGMMHRFIENTEQDDAASAVSAASAKSAISASSWNVPTELSIEERSRLVDLPMTPSPPETEEDQQS